MIAISELPPQKLTAEEYLEWEERQDRRYELIDGEAVAMTGGTVPHNDVAVNLLMLLRPHLRARGCRINISDVKVKVAATGNYFYPDLIISCDDRDRNAMQLLEHPTVLVEVLSPSTANNDRDKKLKNYRLLPSLREYILVNPAEIWVECYRRRNEVWICQTYGPGDTVQFESIEFSCPIELLYEDVTFAHDTQ